MSNLTISPITFNFDSTEVRVIAIDGEPHFVGKDVCAVLGYANASKAMGDHCKGVTKRYPLQTAGGMQQIRFLAEPDVLRLIVNSKLPGAQEFERLVFEEILPSIRRTGRYAPPSPATHESREPAEPMDARPETPSLAAQYKAAIPVASAVVELGAALGWTLERSQAMAADVIQRKMGVDIGEPINREPAATINPPVSLEVPDVPLSCEAMLEYVRRTYQGLFRNDLALARAAGMVQSTTGRILRGDVKSPTLTSVDRLYRAVKAKEAEVRPRRHGMKHLGQASLL